MTRAGRTMAGSVGGMAKRFAARQFMSVADKDINPPDDDEMCSLHEEYAPCNSMPCIFCAFDADDRAIQDRLDERGRK